MLILAMARRRLSGLLGSFVVLFLGVTVLSMTALMLASARPQVPERYAGAAILVQSPVVDQSDNLFTPSRPWSTTETAGLARRLADVPGVRAAAPDRSFYAQPIVDGRPLRDDRAAATQAHPWSAARLAPTDLTSGRAPRSDGEVVVDRSTGLTPGSSVTMLTASRPHRFTVTGTVDAPGSYVSEATANRMAGGARVVGLLLDRGADQGAVRAAAAKAVGSHGQVLSGKARSSLADPGDIRTRWIGLQILSGMALLAGFVSVFVVASTFAFGVFQRRRELGLLRAVGATPRQVLGFVLGEALALGAVAGVAGGIVGVLLAPLLGRLFVAADLEPVGFTVHLSPWPLLGSFAAGLVVALLGAAFAARRASAVGPLEALRTAVVERHPMSRVRWVLGGTALACGVGFASVVAVTGSDDLFNDILYAAIAAIVGLALLAPGLVPPIVRLVSLPAGRGRGATPMLVAESTLVAARRTASTAAPVLLTVGLAILISGVFQLKATGYDVEAALTRSPYVVMPDGTPGLSDAAVSTAGGASVLPSTIYVGTTGHLDVDGLSPVALDRARAKAHAISGSLRVLEGVDTMAVNASTARAHRWRPGTVTPVTFDDGGTVRMRVVAVLPDDSTTASVLTVRAVVRRHDTSALTEAAYTSTPVRPAATSGARLVDRQTYAAITDAADDRLVRLFIVILTGMALGFAGLAVANTLVMATADRRRDHAVLRLAGATPRQVLGIVAAESTLVVALGSLLGCAVAVPALFAVRSGVSADTGTAVHLAFPWATATVVVGTCLVLALVASVVPARLAMRRTG